MKIVEWTFITNNVIGADLHPICVHDLLPKNYHPYKSLSKEIALSRKGTTYLKCPAHTDFIKNTWVFCAPFDLSIEIEINSSTELVKIYCENISQEVFEQIIDTRFLLKDQQGKNPYPLIGIDWLNVFTCKESLVMQVLPAFMHRNEFTDKTTVIPGEYDIGKWTRPVEMVFEVRSNREKIQIKKGDAISYIKFLSSDSIKLVNTDAPWAAIQECNEIVKTEAFKPLKERYAALEKATESKCPFGHSHG